MKNEIEKQDATPTKDIFRSIIADYDAEISLCELIDNAIDIWTFKKETFQLEIDIIIDTKQQLIRISDNAGGLKKENLNLIMSPGRSSNNHSEEVIGVFGVGSKRAVVALSQQIIIKSCFKKNETYSVEITDEWLKDPSWVFPVYKINDIEKGTTEIELTKLREQLQDDDVKNIREHLSAVYGKILGRQNLKLTVNGEEINSKVFDNIWSFNPTVPPTKFDATIILDKHKIKYSITGGLITEGGDAGHGDYGVYVYCNNRLIAKSLKTFDVGFTKGKVGVPHGSISLARVIIEIFGPADLMPWNSSKSGIDTKHKLFLLSREQIIEVIKHYASSSRALFPERDEKIKPFTDGQIHTLKVDSLSEINLSHLPPRPIKIKKKIDIVRDLNSKVAETEPWIIGAYESIAIAESIMARDYQTKGRVAIILFDSSIEIALKDYLLYKSGQYFAPEKFSAALEKRTELINTVKKHGGETLLSDKDWTQLTYYYQLRCDLIHKKATADIPIAEINKFKKFTMKIHTKLLGIRYPKEVS